MAQTSVIRILGIDPGSRITGYGVIDVDGPRTFYVASGGIKTADDALAPRLGRIFDGVTAAIEEYNPQEMAVELVFMNRNADSALKLGQARGAALVAGAKRGLPVFEFTPAQIKQAIVGRGNAEKTQIQHMIKVLLNFEAPPETDAADALAVALCHAHTREGLLRMPGVRRNRRRRFL